MALEYSSCAAGSENKRWRSRFSPLKFIPQSEYMSNGSPRRDTNRCNVAMNDGGQIRNNFDVNRFDHHTNEQDSIPFDGVGLFQPPFLDQKRPRIVNPHLSEWPGWTHSGGWQNCHHWYGRCCSMTSAANTFKCYATDSSPGWNYPKSLCK